MRRVLLATIGVLALTATQTLAADLPRAMPPPTKAPVFAPGYSWTGFYVGINGGYGWGKSGWSGIGGADPSGGLVGATAGYNWQGVGSPWVFGLEGDIDWADLKGSFANANCPLGCETKVGWLGTVRGRLGYAFDRVMPYITGGLAVGEVKATPFGFGSVSDTRVGWTVGAGVEAALSGNWTAKVEYLYADLGNTSCDVITCGAPIDVDFHSHIVRAGLNMRF
jgi:outer membrane immunogenic protein